jgi:hypothetical protein
VKCVSNFNSQIILLLRVHVYILDFTRFLSQSQFAIERSRDWRP